MPAKIVYTPAQKRAYAFLRKKYAKAKANKGGELVRTTRVPLYMGMGGYAKKSQRGYLGRVGSSLGGKAGGFIGDMVGAVPRYLYKTLTGSGDYKVKSNTLLNGGLENEIQVGQMHGRGATRIRHREYLSDILSSVGFAIRNYDINPANTLCFPWLSLIASNFEQWRALGIVFEFVSTSSNALNSTNTALGSINLCTQYNSLSPPFATKQEVLNYEFSVSTKPADSICHPIECEPSETPSQPLYTRTGTVGAGDLRLYDLGRFSVSSSGSQAVATVGELWITYDILLMKPKLNGPDSSGSIPMGHWFIPPDATLPPSGLVPFGGASVDPTSIENIFSFPSGPDSQGVILISPISNGIIIPQGYAGSWLIQFIYKGGVFVPTAPFNNTLVNLVHNNQYQNKTEYRSIAEDETGTCVYTYLVTIVDGDLPSSLTLVPSAGTTLPTDSSIEVFVTQLNGNYRNP